MVLSDYLLIVVRYTASNENKINIESNILSVAAAITIVINTLIRDDSSVG